jgi:hypothetical protein
VNVPHREQIVMAEIVLFRDFGEERVDTLVNDSCESHAESRRRGRCRRHFVKKVRVPTLATSLTLICGVVMNE